MVVVGKGFEVSFSWDKPLALGKLLVKLIHTTDGSVPRLLQWDAKVHRGHAPKNTGYIDVLKMLHVVVIKGIIVFFKNNTI